jgi:hypothetical protein
MRNLAEEMMLASIWDFLQAESNRAVLGWVGGGVVAVAGGLWAIFKFFLATKKKGEPVSTVSAKRA